MEQDHENKKSIIPFLLAAALIILVVAVTAGVKLVKKYSYSKEKMDLAQYYGLEEDGQTALVLGDEILEEKALCKDGQFFLPLSFVQEKLNNHFYYDATQQLLIYTTPLEIYEMTADSSSYTISGQPQENGSIIWTLQGGEPYLEMNFLTGYANFRSEIFSEPDRIQLYLEPCSYESATVKKNTAVRYQGGVKSDILEPLEKGETVFVLEQMETWSKVKTSDSVIGYVENKRLEDAGGEAIEIPDAYVSPTYTSIRKEGLINLVWHQVTNTAANQGVDALLAQTKGVTTISPTWFFLQDNYGNFTSLADQAYVDNMHARGVEVWALVENFTNDVDIAQVLGTTTNRKNLESQLVSTVSAYGIDGINVDFEQIPAEAGEDFVQFLRELSVSCRQNGIVLSVDNYVPTGYTAHYNRKEQGEVVDYFIIMGYDEHYSGSQEAGSVASIDYVREGIENTIADVPEEKVINGIPFYTRMWKLADGVTSEALSMNAAKNYLAQYGVAASWDDATCQNYASFEADGATYQIWLEDADSIRAKLNVMSVHRLAGVAAWKLGLETPDIWDVIAEYLSGSMAGTEAAEDPQTDGTDAQTVDLQQEAPLQEIVTD